MIISEELNCSKNNVICDVDKLFRISVYGSYLGHHHGGHVRVLLFMAYGPFYCFVFVYDI